MKRVLIGSAIVLASLLASALSADEAYAHGRHSRIGVSIGYGYGGFGWPWGIYGGYAYPRSYIGVTVRPGSRRDRSAESDERNVNQQALYVYPASGQTEEQLADDRYDCHVWSVDATGFDPTLGAGKREEAENYARAFTACMEGRGYVVR